MFRPRVSAGQPGSLRLSTPAPTGATTGPPTPAYDTSVARAPCKERSVHPRSTVPLAALAFSLAGASFVPLGASAAPQPAAPGLSSARPDASFGASARDAALHHAREQAPALASALGLSRTEKLLPQSVERDADGTEHVRYDRTVDGLRVIC